MGRDNKSKMSIREKLELMKEMDRRNEERRKEFIKKQAHNEKVFELYEQGKITKEQFEKYYKE